MSLVMLPKYVWQENVTRNALNNAIIYDKKSSGIHIIQLLVMTKVKGFHNLVIK